MPRQVQEPPDGAALLRALRLHLQSGDELLKELEAYQSAKSAGQVVVPMPEILGSGKKPPPFAPPRAA